MKEYKGIYLPTKRHRKPREHKFQAVHDKRAAVKFAVLCYDCGWKLLNVLNEKKEVLFCNGKLMC